MSTACSFLDMTSPLKMLIEDHYIPADPNLEACFSPSSSSSPNHKNATELRGSEKIARPSVGKTLRTPAPEAVSASDNSPSQETGRNGAGKGKLEYVDRLH